MDIWAPKVYQVYLVRALRLFVDKEVVLCGFSPVGDNVTDSECGNVESSTPSVGKAQCPAFVDGHGVVLVGVCCNHGG